MNSLFQDIRYGLRTLLKNPSFTVVAVLALTLGIGANATVITLANSILFKNLPFADSERILYISGVNRSNSQNILNISLSDYRDFAAQTRSFQSLGAFSYGTASLADGGGFPIEYRDAKITANGFSVIGQKPIIGRDFLPQDAQFGAPPVAILGYGIWETRYAKDPAVIGKVIHLNDVSTTVIGVMPRGFSFPDENGLWLPLVVTPDLERRQSHPLRLFGRLAPGANLKTANVEMDGIARRLEAANPDTNKDRAVVVQTFNDAQFRGQIRVVFLALLGAVGFVLLIACANVANLLLARAVSRSREISVRVALGASRWRIVRQLLIESLMLSAAGGIIGTALAFCGVRIFDRAVTPNGKPAFLIFAMDYQVLAYIAVLALGTGILFGLAPALRLSNLDINSTLKDGTRGSGSGRHSRYLSAALVVSEMALAVVLLSGAGLMIRSFLNVASKPIGVDSNNVLTAQINLRGAKYKSTDSQLAFFQQLQTRLQALPGVEYAALTSRLPAGGSVTYNYELEGSPAADARTRPEVEAIVVTPDYFPVMKLFPVQGRSFTSQDGISGVPVVIVNRSFAEKFFARQDPLGKRLHVVKRHFDATGAAVDEIQPWLTIVGVVPDVIQERIEDPAVPLLYFPLRQEPQSGFCVALRTSVPPGTLANSLRREVQLADENLPVNQPETMANLLLQRSWPWRVFGSMFAIFAVIALILASVGLYGVIGHSVSQRTQEIGVRVALGASSGRILRLVFVQGMRQLAIGMAIGLAAAFAVTRVVNGLLVGVSSTDPTTFVIVAVVLLAAGILGCLIPARRAVRVDPVIALRHD
nr:ABC transporter permease [Candidatus Acidoferrales bacterium]